MVQKTCGQEFERRLVHNRALERPLFAGYGQRHGLTRGGLLERLGHVVLGEMQQRLFVFGCAEFGHDRDIQFGIAGDQRDLSLGVYVEEFRANRDPPAARRPNAELMSCAGKPSLANLPARSLTVVGGDYLLTPGHRPVEQREAIEERLGLSAGGVQDAVLAPRHHLIYVTLVAEDVARVARVHAADSAAEHKARGFLPSEPGRFLGFYLFALKWHAIDDEPGEALDIVVGKALDDDRPPYVFVGHRTGDRIGTEFAHVGLADQLPALTWPADAKPIILIYQVLGRVVGGSDGDLGAVDRRLLFVAAPRGERGDQGQRQA